MVFTGELDFSVLKSSANILQNISDYILVSVDSENGIELRAINYECTVLTYVKIKPDAFLSFDLNKPIRNMYVSLIPENIKLFNPITDVETVLLTIENDDIQLNMRNYIFNIPIIREQDVENVQHLKSVDINKFIYPDYDICYILNRKLFELVANNVDRQEHVYFDSSDTDLKMRIETNKHFVTINILDSVYNVQNSTYGTSKYNADLLFYAIEPMFSVSGLIECYCTNRNYPIIFSINNSKMSVKFVIAPLLKDD